MTFLFNFINNYDYFSREARLNLQRMNGDTAPTGMRIDNEVKLLISC